VSVLAPLRAPAFRWLAAGRFVSLLGNAIAPVALAFAVLDLTGSLRDLGLVVAARSASNVALLLFGGVLADRLPRQLLLVGSGVAAAATQAAVAALVLTGTATVPLLALLGVVNGAVAALALPASAGLTPQTVPPALLQEANTVLRLGISTAQILGAALGGLLVAAVGPGWGLAADAVCFALAALAFRRVVLPGTAAPPARSTSVVHDLREGWGEFVSRTWVWVVVAQFAVVNAAQTGAVAVLGPAVADAELGRRAWGLVLAALTAGFLAGGLVALVWRPRRALLVGVLGVVTLALPVVLLAAWPVLPALVLGMFLAGVWAELFGIAWDVSLQENVPADRLSRVYSYDMVGSFVAIPLGEAAVGPLAEAYGLHETLYGCAALIVAATLLAACSRSVRTLRRRDVPTPLTA